MEDAKENISEMELNTRIQGYFSYYEEYSLKNVAKTCAKLIISEYFPKLCMETFKMPSFEEVKEWVVDEIRQHFDEKMVPLIESVYPDLSDDDLDTKILAYEKLFHKEHEEQIESTTNAAIREIKIRVKGIQKELENLKSKYTI